MKVKLHFVTFILFILILVGIIPTTVVATPPEISEVESWPQHIGADLCIVRFSARITDPDWVIDHNNYVTRVDVFSDQTCVPLTWYCEMSADPTRNYEYFIGEYSGPIPPPCNYRHQYFIRAQDNQGEERISGPYIWSTFFETTIVTTKPTTIVPTTSPPQPNTPPVISDVTHNPDPVMQSGSVSFSARVIDPDWETDNTNYVNIVKVCSDQACGTVYCTMDVTPNTNYEYYDCTYTVPSSFSPGSRNFYIWASDTKGASAYSGPYTFTINPKPTTITIPPTTYTTHQTSPRTVPTTSRTTIPATYTTPLTIPPTTYTVPPTIPTTVPPTAIPLGLGCTVAALGIILVQSLRKK